MPPYEKLANVEIAAMKKQETANYNVMLPGDGTPWEDRGRIGFIPAFFKTCFRSLFNHRALLDHIRRPATTSEATGFAIGCAALWGVSIAIWDAFLYYKFSNDTTLQVDGQQYLIEAVLRCVGTIALVFVFLHIATRVFVALLSNASQQQIPRPLIYNVLAYSLGPSILAFVPIDVLTYSLGVKVLTIVPLFSWTLMGLWIMIDALAGAKARLYLRTREVLANVIIVAVVIVVLLTIVSLTCYYVEPLILGRSVTPIEVTKPAMMN